MYSNEMIKKLYRVSLAALVIGLGTAAISPAQALLPAGSPNVTGPTPLNQPAAAANANEASQIPDEIALFDTEADIPTPGSGMITPNNGSDEAAPPVVNNLATERAPGSNDNNMPTPGQNAGSGMPAPQPSSGPAAAPAPAVNKAGGALPTLQPGNPLFAKNAAAQSEKDILSEVDNELFNQMSDIEKQTALLTLELRREKIRAEIDAMKAQRQKAIEEQKNMDADRENKRLAMEKELEQKIIAEQTKLRKIELAFEKLRQERLLTAYKEHMLQEEQKWIKSNQDIYDEIANQKKEQTLWATKYKEKLQKLVSLSENVMQDAQIKMDSYKREVNDLQTQISILKARLEAQQKTNPFGQEGGASTAAGGQGGGKVMAPVKKSINLGDLYVIMEISGQRDDISARLMNREGQTFLVKPGTKLKSGDVVKEITPTYIKTDHDGDESFLYFASGGVMDSEPEGGSAAKKAMAARGATGSGNVSQANPRGLVTSKGVPGVSRDMMLR
jgi:hypothetical protein